MQSINRPLLNLIPRSACHILDVGCAGGELGAALKERQNCQVVGIEIDPLAAERARGRLDYVICDDVGEVAPGLGERGFDCVVLGDVLEHLPDPEGVLGHLRPLLDTGGRLVLSVPNVRHWSVVRDLLEGHWTYKERGLLDKTHCRLFTRDSLEHALRASGFRVICCNSVMIPDQAAPKQVIPALAALGLDVSTLWQESAVYQWLVVAEPDDAPEPLTSIVVLAHNLWPQTEACLRSVFEHTPERYEVIVVDNASTDETPARLEELSRECEMLRVIANDENLSFAAGNNAGIRESSGDYVLLLNNDTVVTGGWMGRMLGVFEENPQAGIVGPMSNYVAGLQRVPKAEYNTRDEMQAFAREWSQAHAGETQQVAGVIGFCLMVKRGVLDEIGLLDERFINGYEETDLCYRAVGSGYEVQIARDVFVHHTGSQTFIEQGADPRNRSSRYWSLIDENWERFREKWGIPGGMSANEGLDWLTRRLDGYSGGPRVFWAVLFERSLAFEPVDRFMDIAAECARSGFERIVIPYTATDNARNHIERKFLFRSQHPDDVLVMLDADHMHPKDIVHHLAGYEHEIGVVGALAFRRGEPHDPQFYVRDGNGDLQQPANIEELGGCLAVGDLVGTGAVAVKRWVFDALSEAGYYWPHWRVQYPEDALNRPGEEMYFAKCCETLGIRHYCAIEAETPHISSMLVGRRTWETYRRKHPEIVKDLEEVRL